MPVKYLGKPQKKISLSDLPNEMLALIFLQIPDHKTLNALAKTCVRFRNIIMELEKIGHLFPLLLETDLHPLRLGYWFVNVASWQGHVGFALACGHPMALYHPQDLDPVPYRVFHIEPYLETSQLRSKKNLIKNFFLKYYRCKKSLSPFKKTDSVVKISQGLYHRLVLLKSGVAYLQGDFSKEFCPEASWSRLALNDKIIDIVASLEHALLLTQSGHVWALGHNRSGQLGSEVAGDYTLLPIKLEIEHVVKIAVGAEHSLFLDKYERLYSCGYGFSGASESADEAANNNLLGAKEIWQLQEIFFPWSDRQKNILTIPAEYPSTIVSIIGGQGFSLALSRCKKDGLYELWFWGRIYSSAGLFSYNVYSKPTLLHSFHHF